MKPFSTLWLPSIRSYIQETGYLEIHEFNAAVTELQNLFQLSEHLQQALAAIWEGAPKVLGTVLNIVMVPPLYLFPFKGLP